MAEGLRVTGQGELCISRVPGLKGIFLGLQEGARFTALARFGNGDAVTAFKAWAERSNGKVLHFSQEEA
jgi:hypothetical protein